MKKILLLFILALSVFAKEVDISKNIIQLGVFKDEKNIQKLKNRYKDLDLYVKVFPNKLKKLFVVNITKKDTAKTLTRIKKDIPKAFLLSKKRKEQLFITHKHKDWLNKSLSQKSNHSKLDSKAIIKTRNKFFE